MVLFENVCKPTALVSEWLSRNALHRETVSGRDEAVLPMRSQPGLETEHTSQDGGVWGQDTTPISVGLQDKPGSEGGVQNEISRPHPDWTQPPGVGPGMEF